MLKQATRTLRYAEHKGGKKTNSLLIERNVGKGKKQTIVEEIEKTDNDGGNCKNKDKRQKNKEKDRQTEL